jgi:multicomponent Na+:H+ antiporter subunit D
VALPVVLPLVAAALSILVGRFRAVQRAIGIVTLTVVAAVAVILLVHVDGDGTVVSQAGDWGSPVGITLVADRLAAVMLCVSSLVLLAVLVFAVGEADAERTHVGFHPVYLMLAAGVSLAFVTGDLFDLFVAVEVALMASYVLITLGGRRRQVRAGMTYVVISLLASTLFLTTLAFTYGATGTVNLADLSGKVAELPDGVRTALALLLVVVFGTKAAVFPLYFWLPDSYPTAPAPVTAVLAGLLTKVGVYGLIRTQTLLVPPGSQPGALLLVVAGATMLVGVLGAIAQRDVRRALSFQVVSQIGYIVMGLGLFSAAGLAAAVFYVAQTIVVKTTLFLVAGVVERVGGTGRLSRLGGMAHRVPAVGVVFLVSALGLVGVPPFAGFVAKVGLLQAGAAADRWWIVGVALVASLLTLFSMMRIWTAVFWGTPSGPTAAGGDDPVPWSSVRSTTPALMVAPLVGLCGLGLAMTLAAGPLYGVAERAADDLVDPSVYVSAVLEP